MRISWVHLGSLVDCTAVLVTAYHGFTHRISWVHSGTLAYWQGTVVLSLLQNIACTGVPRPGRHSFAPTFHHSQHQSPWWHRDEMSTTISRQPDVQWKQTKDHLKGIYTEERNMMLLQLFLLILSSSDKQKRISCCCCCYHGVLLVFDVSLSICRLKLRY